MTAIAGVVDQGKVWIGGDSAGVGHLSIQVRTDPKVFKNGEFVIGYTSSFRMGQILEHHLQIPVPLEGQGGMSYMLKSFIPAVKACLKDHGFQKTVYGEDSGGTFLAGYRGELYYIEDDYQVGRIKDSYYACGCGRDLVLGSLYTTKTMDMSPTQRIELALNAAAEFSAGVRGPFNILST